MRLIGLKRGTTLRCEVLICRWPDVEEIVLEKDDSVLAGGGDCVMLNS